MICVDLELTLAYGFVRVERELGISGLKREKFE